MKNYQTVISSLPIAVAIMTVGILIVNSTQAGFESLRSVVSYPVKLSR